MSQCNGGQNELGKGKVPEKGLVPSFFPGTFPSVSFHNPLALSNSEAENLSTFPIGGYQIAHPDHSNHSHEWSQKEFRNPII